MNHSIYSADRTTHLKIVAVALIAGISLAGLGIASRVNDMSNAPQSAQVIKAGKPTMNATAASTVVR